MLEKTRINTVSALTRYKAAIIKYSFSNHDLCISIDQVWDKLLLMVASFLHVATQSGWDGGINHESKGNVFTYSNCRMDTPCGHGDDLKIWKQSPAWWHMPVIPALGTQRQADF